MKRLRSILVYANESSSSEAALRRAEALAATSGALLCVVDVLPDSDGPWRTLPREIKRQQAAATARLRELGLLVAPAWQRGVEVQVQVLTGSPVVEILREVKHGRHDLVLVSSDAGGDGPGQLLGNTALHLLRKCPCPVWVIRPEEGTPRKRILAAVALDAGGWEQDESVQVLQLAASVAESDDSVLRIVHCLGPWTSDISAKWRKDDSQRRLDGLLARCDLGRVRHDIRLERQAAVDVIGTLCDEVDLLVMGTVWRGGPAGVLIGDTAEDALARVDCSVLAVKPRGFIMPDANRRPRAGRRHSARGRAA